MNFKVFSIIITPGNVYGRKHNKYTPFGISLRDALHRHVNMPADMPAGLNYIHVKFSPDLVLVLVYHQEKGEMVPCDILTTERLLTDWPYTLVKGDGRVYKEEKAEELWDNMTKSPEFNGILNNMVSMRGDFVSRLMMGARLSL